MQRYFLDETPTGQQFKLPETVAHHFITVLRSREGAKAEFVLPNSQDVVIGEIAELHDDYVLMTIISRQTLAVELPVDTTIIIGLAKGDKSEFVVQKATELGAHHIIIVETDWSVSHWGQKAAKKIVRLNKIAAAAAEQSHRLKIPDVTYVPKLTELSLPKAMTKIVAWEESAKKGETGQLVQKLQALQPDDAICFLFGPEGGLTPAEIDYLLAEGFVAAGLGPRILRAETAPMYALSTLSYVMELNK
ncbi:RsmE family RNA methyltransferase [Weissella hellenica]|uniref:Ribosomal RNA small subunit methyltransferase E n=1 Tax=Weissella hellenica TaxID=46256 RepID=A0A4Y4G5E8_WEIHE|nr:RsmE family RNA methyltransferase [Weissella hellenica]NKY67060.1 16S rRNA (uracil(1498)-N(3))-methyltransferase [Weissella hellenica]GED36075.1 ribosomal RNA small subunit methyltransferase E [Weissella hellenica]SCB95810.1 16S rRNA (uracil1498-N3)-methyltransferase [Weissella hellenica]